MRGRHVLATLGAVLIATAVIPPLGAFAVNRARVRSAEAALRALVDTVRSNESELSDLSRSAGVVCGPGQMPRAVTQAAQGWVTAVRAPWNSARNDHAGRLPDPWGNCYVVDLAAFRSPGAPVWALSAGPDGIIDTPFGESRATPAGNDIGMRIR